MTVRYGAIGCGRAFERLHLPVLSATPGVELVAVYDADPARAKAVGGDGVAVAESLDDLLGYDLDAVSVCTPNDRHVDDVLAAVAAGVRVLCEKPLAHAPDALRRLVSALPATAPVAVNLPYAVRPPDVGGAMARVELATPGARLWRPVSDWYADPRRSGGGALLDLGVHAFSLLAACFGGAGEVEACSLGEGAVEDAATVLAAYGETRVEVVVNRRSPRVVATVTADAGSYDLRGTETAAVAAFVSGGSAPGVALARAAEETVWAAYALARS